MGLNMEFSIELIRDFNRYLNRENCRIQNRTVRVLCWDNLAWLRMLLCGEVVGWSQGLVSSWDRKLVILETFRNARSEFIP